LPPILTTFKPVTSFNAVKYLKVVTIGHTELSPSTILVALFDKTSSTINFSPVLALPGSNAVIPVLPDKSRATNLSAVLRTVKRLFQSVSRFNSSTLK
jgi:hypothetical protein